MGAEEGGHVLRGQVSGEVGSSPSSSSSSSSSSSEGRTGVTVEEGDHVLRKQVKCEVAGTRGHEARRGAMGCRCDYAVGWLHGGVRTKTAAKACGIRPTAGTSL